MSAPAGQGCSWRRRSTSSSVRMPWADSGSLGTPIRVARGSGRSAPRDHTEAAVVAGVTRSSPAPTRVARSMPSGRTASMASAPTSTRWPATRSRRSLPPSRSLPSSTVTSAEGTVRSASRAAVRPAMPPPTTTTWGRVVTAGADMSASLSRERHSRAARRAAAGLAVTDARPIRRWPRTRDRNETRRREPTATLGATAAASTTKESSCAHRSAPPAGSPPRLPPSPSGWGWWPCPGAAALAGDSGTSADSAAGAADSSADGR